MPENRPVEWQIPRVETDAVRRKAWIDELIQNGDRWVRNQKGIASIQEDVRLLMGGEQSSNATKSNSLQIDVRSFVETISDLKQIATLGTRAPWLKQYVTATNGAIKYIFHDSQFVPKTRKALQYAMLGRGYLWQKYSRDKYGWGKGRITWDALGPLEVLPEQLPFDNDVQGAYANTIIIPMPIAEAHARFPRYQEWLKPISRYDWKSYGTLGLARRLDFYDRFRFGEEDPDWDNHYCVPLDSEILTKAGWKRHSEVLVGDEVMGYNHETRRCEWTKLTNITIKKSQDVYRYGSQKFGVRCTRDHRWVVKKRAPEKVRRQQDVFYNHHTEMSTIDDCNTASILIQAAPGPDGPGLGMLDSSSYLVRADAVRMVLQMTSAERRAFIVGMLYGEGTTHAPKSPSGRPTTLFAQKEGPVYDAMKLACALEGIGTNEGYYADVSVGETKVFTLRHTPHKKIGDLRKEHHSVEDVWCPTTELGTWVMRQGDLITITGNCEIRYSFVRDLRQNDTGREIDMESASPWGYKVPAKNSLVFGTNPYNGLPESHVATPEETRMYPQLRLVITSPSVPVPMRDGCGFNWHGEMPIVQYDVNDWAWSPIGYSMVQQVSGLESARRKLLSKMQEVVDVTLDPPLGYDLHAGVSRTQLEKVDILRSQGFRVGVNGDPKKGLVSVLPESIKVESDHFKQLEVLAAEMKNSLGLNDLASLRELKMNMSSENMDKILENLGPISLGIAMSMGVAHGKIAQMLKYDIPQHITVAELLDMIGPDGVAIETFDSDPNSLVPARLPGEHPRRESAYNRRMRAKHFADKVGVISKPTQLLNVTEMQERMMYLLFLQKGIKVSTPTIMEKLGVQNYGEIPGDTELEKWQNEQIQMEFFKLKAQRALQLEAASLGIQPQGEPGPGQGKGGGRPPSGKKPPHEETRGTKTGNPRVIMAQS